MNETELRSALAGAAERIPPRVDVPPSLLRRARTRKSGTVVTSMAVIALIATGAVAGRDLFRRATPAAATCNEPFEQITSRPAEVRENAVASSGSTTFLASGNGYVAIEGPAVVFSATFTRPGATARIYDIASFDDGTALAVGVVNTSPKAPPGTVEETAAIWKLGRTGFTREATLPGTLLNVAASGPDAWASGRSRAGALLLKRSADGSWTSVSRPRDIFAIEDIAAPRPGRLIVLTPAQSFGSWTATRYAPLWQLDGTTWTTLPSLGGMIMGMASHHDTTWVLLGEQIFPGPRNGGSPIRFPSAREIARLNEGRWTTISFPEGLVISAVAASSEGAWVGGYLGPSRRPYVGLVTKDSLKEVPISITQGVGDVFDIEPAGRSVVLAGSSRYTHNPKMFVAVRSCGSKPAG